MLFKKVRFLYTKLEKIFNMDGRQESFLLFFRIAISIIAIIEFASLATDLPLFFSSSGTLIPQELLYLQTGYFKYLHPFYDFLEENGFTESFYKISVFIYLTALLFLLIGLFTRYAAGIALIFQLIIFRSFAPFNYGFDYFLTMSLFYCLIFPVGYYFSIDKMIFKRFLRTDFNYRRVLQIHLTIAYFFSGIAKGLDVGWWNGNSVWKALASTDNTFYSIPPVILLIVGVGTVLLEFSYPILAFWKITRKYTLFAIILMHTSIAIMMDLYAFSTIMIVWNIAAFGNIASAAPKRTTHVETI